MICGKISNGEETENGLEEICQNKWLMTLKKLLKEINPQIQESHQKPQLG